MTFSPKNIKKVELHVHLDTCLSFHYIKQVCPGITLDDFTRIFIAPTKCGDLAHFLHKVAPQIEILQTRTAIALAVEDLFKQLAADNVIYAEIRFAPLLHLEMGLRSEEVVETVIAAMQRASLRYNIDANLLLCTLRHFNRSGSEQTANLVLDFLGRGVVGLDLAADEARFPLDNHIHAFQKIREAGGGVIAHAGEARGAESIDETLTCLQVSRIGHGVRCIEDPRVIERLRDENILLEICPSCNVVCDVFDTLESHPINDLKEMGIRLNVNTDARTVANTTLNNEYQLLHETFGWTEADFYRCNEHALEASFIDHETRQRLMRRLTA